MNSITDDSFKIVMYHYVRDLEKSKYPLIKALDKAAFEFQIHYLKKKYTVLDPITVKEIVSSRDRFPKKACWLTFDDGYIDHYEVVLPILEANNIKASFFPPVTTTRHEDVLEANKIHYILAAVNNIELLLEEVKNLFYHYQVSKLVGCDFSELCLKVDTRHRYDVAKVVLFKRLLQKELPKKIRKTICHDLFSKYVSSDSQAFAKELYMGIDQLAELNDLGHEIGLHGYDHYWLSKHSDNDQYQDIELSLDFFRTNKLIDDDWALCYPHGDYNQATLVALKKLGCLMAITTVPENVPSQYLALELPRWNTNDFPQAAI